MLTKTLPFAESYVIPNGSLPTGTDAVAAFVLSDITETQPELWFATKSSPLAES